MLIGWLHPQQGHHACHFRPFGGPEGEYSGDAVRHLLVQQVARVLGDEDQRGVAGPAHPRYLGNQLRALRRRGDRPRLVQDDRLRQPAVHAVQQPPGELGHQVEQRHGQPLLVGVVVALDRGVRQGEAGQGEDRRPASGVDPEAAGRGEAQPGEPHLRHRAQHRPEVHGRGIGRSFEVVHDLAQAGALRGGDGPHGLDHRAFPLLAHSRQQQPQRLGGHRPLLGQVVAERERVEQAGRGVTERQHPSLAAALLQQPDQRLGIALRVDHRDRHPAQRELQDQQQREGRLAAAGLAGDRDGGRAVARGGDQRVEIDDRPGPAERLADVRSGPAGIVGDPVADVHRCRGHAARDRVERLPLQVGAEPDLVTWQRFTQQRELVSGGVDDIDARIPVVLGHRLGPAHAEVPRRGGHHQPVVAVDERQPFLGDAVLQQAGGLDLLGQGDRRFHAGLPDVRVHVPGVRQPAADVLARLGRRDQLHPQADLDRERERVGIVQPGLALGEVHDVGEAGEGQERGERLPRWLLKPQQGPPVVHLAFQQRLDLAGSPLPPLGGRRPRVAQGAHQRVPEQPGDVVGGRVAGGQRAGA